MKGVAPGYTRISIDIREDQAESLKQIAKSNYQSRKQFIEKKLDEIINRHQKAIA